MEEDLHTKETARASLSPGIQKHQFGTEGMQGSHFLMESQEPHFAEVHDHVSNFPTVSDQASDFASECPVQDERVLHFRAEGDQGSQFSTEGNLGAHFEVDSQHDCQFQGNANQDSRLTDAHFRGEDAERSHFHGEAEQGSHFPAEDEQGPPFPVEDDQEPHYPAQDHQGPYFSTQQDQDSHFSAEDEQGSHFPANVQQLSLFQVEGSRDSLFPDGGKQSSYIPVQHHQNNHFPVEGDQSSQFQPQDEVVSHFPTVVGQGSRYPAEDTQTSQFRAKNDRVSQVPIEADEVSGLSVGGNQCPIVQLTVDAQIPGGGDGTRKRKLAVFAAAGAVIAIQTMLVAMPEIWQPLEDDDSAEKVAYQEGLHSWFGALNRAAWLLSTANGAGDGGWWVKPRASVWFNTYLMSSNEDERWVSALHMRRKTFLWICNSLEVHVRKQDTRLRPSIPVTVRVGATLYRLVNGVDYYEVADKFGVGESSVHEIMQDCVPAIVKVFGHHLSWPTGEEVTEVSRGFYEKCGLPNCQGALGSTHVEILNPSGPEAKKYINRTGHFSIVLQAVADSSLSFLDVFCGYPERIHDNKVLRSSSLYDRSLAGDILAGPIQPINGGFQLRPYILGGPNYPLCPWLMVPYPSSPQLSYSQQQFIHHHEQGRIHTQQAFDILKHVFKVLGVGIRGRLELAPTIVHACCLLYNILIRRKELDVKAELGSIGATSHNEDREEGASELGDNSSFEIRNQLAEFIIWDG